MALPKLVVELAAKIREYMADLDKAATATEASAARIERADKTMVDAAKDVASGQADVADTAVQVASRMGPMGGAVAAAAAVVAGYAVVSYKAAQENTALVKALALSGNQAGVTAGQMHDMAEAGQKVGRTHGQAIAVLSAMASTGKVTASMMEQLTATTLEAQRSLGISAEETIKRFAALADEPVKASLKLAESTNHLTAAAYERIKALEDMGRKDLAAIEAQKAYDASARDAAARVNESLGTVQKAWRSAGEMASWAWDRFMGLGRKETTGQRLNELGESIANLEAQIRERKTVGFNTQLLEAELAKLRDRQGILQSDLRLNKQIANAQAEQAAKLQAIGEWDKKGLAYRDKQAKLEDDIAAARQLGLQAGRSEEEIEKRIAAIREKAAEKSPRGKAASDEYGRLEAEIQKQLDLANQQLVVGRQLTESEKFHIDTLSKIDEALRKKNITQAQATQLTRDMTIAEAARQAVDDKAKRTKIDQALFAQQVQNMEDEAAYNVARSKAWEQSQLALVGYNQSVQDQIDLTQVELGLAGQTQQSRDLALTYYRIALELKKQIRAIDESEGYDSEADREVARARARATAAKARLNAETQSQVSEWNRVFDQVENGLTDALMRGFEAGKSMFANLRDYAGNLFKTLVLRPVVQAISSPVAGAITGALGLSGAANAETGGGSLLGTAGTLSSAYNAINGGITNSITAGFNNLASSRVGQSLGLSVEAAGPSLPGMTAPTQLTSFGQTASSWATTIGGTMAGIALGSMAKSLISGGYSAGKGMGTFQNIGVAVGSAIGGPLVGAIIGAGAGVFNRAFGRKLKDQGIQGEFGGEAGFTGENYQFLKGGWFRSDKTKTSPLDADMQSGLANQFKAIQLQTALMATALGDTGQSVADFTSSIKVSFNGLTEAQIGEKLTETFAGIANDLAQTVLGDSAFAKEGEVASQTLQRLSTSLTTVNATWDALGFTLEAVSLAGGGAASSFIDLMGGLENFTAATAGYYANFYTETERAQFATEQLSGELGKLGQTMPTTRDGFRALVQAAEAAGNDALLAGLLNLQDEFAALVPAADSAAKAVSGVMSSLEADTKRLQRQLIEAQGGDLAAFDTQGMTLAERAVYAYNASLQEQIDATKAASTAAKEAAAAQEQAARDATEAAQEYARAQEQAAQAARAAVETAMSAVSSAQSTIDGIRGEATNRYLSAQQAVANAQDNIANLQVQAMQKVQQAAYDAAKKLQDLGKTLTEFVTGKLSSPEQTFANTLRKALAGDTEAMAALPNAATGASDAAALAASTSTEARIAQARIMADVLRVANLASGTALPGVTPDADPMVAATNALTQAQADMAAALTLVQTIGASTTSRADDLLSRYTSAVADLATAQDEYAIALKAIATNTGNTATYTSNTAANTAANASNSAAQVAAINALKNATTSGLESVRVNTAISAAGVNTGAVQAVVFAANDPLLSIFNNIGRTNELLIDGLQLQLAQLLGTSFNDNLQAQGGYNSAFMGTYQIQADTRYFASEINRWNSGIYTEMVNLNRKVGPTTPTTDTYQIQLDSRNYLSDSRSYLSEINRYSSGIYNELLTLNRAGSSGHLVRFARGLYAGSDVYAQGGVFTNSVVSQPTMFPLGLMGEAGPEAIMPLTSIGGSLGVRYAGPDFSDFGRGMQAMAAEIASLRAEVQGLRAEARATAVNTGRTQDLLKRVSRNGEALQTETAT